MSNEIDQRVVQMEFDNKNFENNVKTSMSTLDKLKRSLNFGSASKGLDGLSSSAKNLGSENGFGGLGSAVDAVKLKISALQVMGVTALVNITNAAINAGTQMVKALTIDPIKTGFQEYETQINAVQTILANTESKGSTLNDVNAALNELNTYADKTIYNFTEMTRNIGTFTAAGVELDTSVQAIKGIANLAAVSGSNSQQASVAMYQLSQALAAGTVKLMDWNSVVNAGMGGQVFQDSLKETARVHGIAIDDMITKEGSFRETLQNGWLTSEILTETLAKFTGDLSESQLKSMGYTDEQIEKIMKLGVTANDAATKVKTFTQLFDTLKEAAQSGWTQTWQLLIGDFGEAKSLLTSISDTVGAFIGKMSDARNNLLAAGLSSGWKQFLNEGVSDEAGYVEEIKIVAKDHGIELDKMIEKEGSFAATLKSGWLTSDIMAESLENLTKKTEGLSDKELEALGYTRDQIDALEDLNESVKDGSFNIEEFADNMTKMSGRENIITALTNTFKFLASAIKPIGEAFREVFPALKGDQLYAFTEKLKDLTEKFKLSDKTVENIKKTFKGLFAPIKLVGKIIIGVASFVFHLAGNLGGLFSAILSVTGAIGNWVSTFTEAIDKTKFLTTVVGWLQKILGNLISFIGELADGAGDAFSYFAEAINTLFSDIDFGKAFDVISAGLWTAISIFFAKFMKKFTEGFGEFFSTVKDLGGIKGILDDVRGCLQAYQQNLKAKALLQIAMAIGLLALSIAILSSIDAASLAKALAAISIMFGELLLTMQVFTKIGPQLKGVLKAIPMLIALSVAILILAAALKIISTIKTKDVVKSLMAIGVLMAELLLFLKAANFKGLTLASVGLIAFGISLLILASALKILGDMKWNEILKGLTAMAGVLAILAIVLRAMPMTSAISGAGLIIVAAALVILAKALQMFGSMPLTDIGKGLIAIGLCLTILAVALNFMTGTIPGSVALLIAAVSLAMLTPVLKSLGKMKWTSIAKGLLALAGVFLVIGVAGLALTPLIGTLLALSASFLIFGLAILAIGAGITLIGIGLTAIAAGFAALSLSAAAGATALVAAIKIIMVGLVDMIPDIIDSLKEAVYALADLFAECAPALAASLLIFIVETMKQLATYTPMIVNALADFLINVMDALAARMPELSAAFVKLFMSIFSGLADAIGLLDPEILIQALLSVGVLLAVIVALSAISSFIPGAMLGLLGVGLIIAEMALIIAAIGALAQIPGLEWLMSEGGDFLATLGTAIGQFIGGIAGGIASGFSESLPTIADNLSEFMENIQPFIDGAKEIDASVMEGVEALADVILTLTEASLLDAVTNFLTGGNSLADFAKDIVPFGEAMKGYSDAVQGIDGAAVSKSAEAAKGLVEVADAIPNDGGVFSWFIGNNNIGTFGKSIAAFGRGLKAYSDSVVGIDTSAIDNSVDATQGIVDLAKKIPKEPGWLEKIFTGDNSITNFAGDLVNFGVALGVYSAKVSGIRVEGIHTAVTAVTNILSMFSSIKDADIDTDSIEKFKDSIGSLAQTDMSGLSSALSNTDLSSVGSGLMKSLSSGFTSGAKSLTATASSISKSIATAFGSQQSTMGKIGQQLLNALIKGFVGGKSKLTSTTKVMVSQLPVLIRSQHLNFYKAGQYITDGVARGIRNKIPTVRSAVSALVAAARTTFVVSLRIHSPSKVTTGYGEYTGQGFVNGLLNLVPKVKTAASSISETAKTGLMSAVSNLSSMVENGINTQPTIRPVLDLSGVSDGTSALNGMLAFDDVGILATANSIGASFNQNRQNGNNNEDVVEAINKLKAAIDESESNKYQINGITYDGGSAVSEAVQSLVRAAKIERRK